MSGKRYVLGFLCCNNQQEDSSSSSSFSEIIWRISGFKSSRAHLHLRLYRGFLHRWRAQGGDVLLGPVFWWRTRALGKSRTNTLLPVKGKEGGSNPWLGDVDEGFHSLSFSLCCRGFYMAPSFDCVSNLLCAEDASIVAWDDENESLSEEENINNQNNNTINVNIKDSDDVNNNDNDREHPQLAAFLDFPVEDDEIISLLVQKECDHMPQGDYLKRFRNRTLDVSIRQNAIIWILKVHAHYNFGPLTAYLSINYLDRFLSSYQLPQGKAWMLQLLSVACLSLAAKMEETDVPLLLDLQVGEASFVFEARTIQRMELLILSTLEWRLRSITPFSFIDYFVHKAGNTRGKRPPRALMARSVELILSTSRVIDFLDHRPSAIAGAAVMCASEEVVPLLAADYKASLSCRVSVERERIFRCYNLMQELLVDRFWTSKKWSSGSSATPQSPVGVLDVACLSCNSENTIASFSSSLSVNRSAMIGAKRRRLNAFSDMLQCAERV